VDIACFSCSLENGEDDLSMGNFMTAGFAVTGVFSFGAEKR